MKGFSTRILKYMRFFAESKQRREIEMRSTLRQKAGHGELTQAECDALIAQVESDPVTGVTLRSKASQSTGKLAAIHP